MENVNITETILDKKLDGYGVNLNNYVASTELTVTITLEEYRNLIACKAIKEHDVEAANKGKYEREAENARLKAEVDSLRLQIFEMTMGSETKKGEE